MNTKSDVIYAHRIKSGSLAVLVLSGTAMLMIPMCTIFGIMAFFGAKTVHLNGVYVTGLGGLILGCVYGPVFAALLGAFGWIAAYFGIRLIGHFKPFRIEYIPAFDVTPAPLEATAVPPVPPPPPQLAPSPPSSSS